MTKAKFNFLLALVPLVFVSLACGSLKNIGNNEATTTNANTNPFAFNASTANVKPRETPPSTTEDLAESTSGEERQKPAPGKGNVQGKVLFNDQPVEGIEVKICETLSTIMGINCTGKTRTVKTGADGVYVLADLEPMSYGGLTAKVFKSNYYIYPFMGMSMTPQRFAVEADETIFANDIALFKNDIKILSPKSGSKAAAENLEIKWDAYPDAAYYKISLYPNAGGTPPVSGERVDDPTYSVTEPLTNGKYRLRVESFNSGDTKLAETGSDISFTVTGGAEPETKP